MMMSVRRLSCCHAQGWSGLAQAHSVSLEPLRHPPMLCPLAIYHGRGWLTRLCRWSVGSILFLASWAVLMGPYQYVIHLVSGPRLPFTAAYFGSIFMTIYFAVGVRRPALLTVKSPANHARLASLDTPDLDLFHRPTRSVGVVSRQLLSHGESRTPIRCKSRRRSGSCVDERLIVRTGPCTIECARPWKWCE